MEYDFDTRAIHAGQEPDPTTGAIMTPVYLTSTYVQRAPAEHKGYVYARGDNLTRRRLEACLASLEGASFCTAAASLPPQHPACSRSLMRRNCRYHSTSTSREKAALAGLGFGVTKT